MVNFKYLRILPWRQYMFKVPLGYEEFCKPTKYCESDYPKIKELAEEITKNCKSSEEAAKILFEWVRDNIAWNVEKTVGAKKVLEREPRHAVCVDKTNLFIALCRAVGIPARYIILDCELDMKIKDLPRQMKHTAAEVFVNNKWVVADPTFGKQTERVINISEFGKPSWINSKNIKRAKELSSFFILVGNIITRILPSMKKLKKAIEETT